MKLKQQKKADGIFWMALEDMIRQFRWGWLARRDGSTPTLVRSTVFVCRLFSRPAWETVELRVLALQPHPPGRRFA